MKYTIWLPTLLLFACTTKEHKNANAAASDYEINADTIELIHDTEPEPERPAVYANKRFREVIVENIGEDKFRIKGQGQIFEANFNWVVEDGHEELRSGFQMTDAGAPEWGNFDFIIDVPKKRDNSTLTLILFETSAKDGSRQHELPIPLRWFYDYIFINS